MISFQKTLKNRISCAGIGLHSGQKVHLTLLPAPADSGIRFRRCDVAGRGAEIAAAIENVSEGLLCTTLASPGGAKIATVEHLLAAAAGCEIDNMIVEVDAAEIPIMDGSAAPFVFLMECAGIAEQDAPRRAIEILKPVEVRDGDKSARLEPSDGFSLSFQIDYDNAIVASQSLTIDFDASAFKNQISRARTYGFFHEVEHMRAMGLALGGSLDNAVVVSGDRVMNEDGLRFDDEFVRHKLLDAIGDLYLAGAPVIGHFTGVRSGHAVNHALVQKLLDDSEAWRLTDWHDTTIDGAAIPHAAYA
jgi:UDP-3-O-[3-hydroxymyristoyl] N-acetylglucosamine deacetylase